MRTRTVAVVASALAVTLVLGATLAQAVREDSWTPIWQLGWLPAVAVAVVYGTRGRCSDSGRQPTHADG